LTNTSPPVAPWRKALAYWWYLWGLSWCYWGIRMANQSFFRAGIRSFDRALRLWPGFALGYYRRGLIRGRELGEHRLAIADLTSASEIRPDWPEPYLQRGLFHRFHGDPQEAIADLERYVGLAEAGYWRDEAQRQIDLLRAEL